MASNNRRPDPSRYSPEFVLVLTLLSVCLVVALLIWVPVTLGYWLSGESIDLPFLTRVLGVFNGKVRWLPACTVIAVLLGLLLGAGFSAFLKLTGKKQEAHTRVDGPAQYMGTGKDIAAISEASVRQTAQRLGVTCTVPGVPIGNHLLTGAPLYGSFEDLHCDIWGTRTGKTTSRAIPAILAAPGAVLTTSNKRDIVDATRDIRAFLGTVWVFDPQHQCGEAPTWYWNPLTYVTNEVKAQQLADHFASGSRGPNARVDTYFDGEGRGLLAGFLLAAALDERPITDVYRWLTRANDDTPVKILEQHDYTLIADNVSSVLNYSEKQRSGVYGTAKEMVSCLTNREIIKWITREEGDTRPEFSPHDFVSTSDTLYSISKEGRGSAGPLVTALTVAVAEAAEEKASRSQGGRLPTPFIAVLDEVANVCRWADLPNLFSHYGSRGMILIVILQSWAQGVEVWGELGMSKLWSTANVKTYGGNVSEVKFLSDMSSLIGKYDRHRTRVTTSKGSRSVSEEVQRETILDVDELGALPKGRAVVFASGCRPTLVRTVPWMVGPFADQVRASILAHDPKGEDTLAEAAADLAAVEAEFQAEEERLAA